MGNLLLGALVDRFTAATLNPSVWNGTTVTVPVVPSLGMAQLPCPTVNGGVNTMGANGPYDATGQTLSAQVTPVLQGNGGTRTVMKILVDANNSVAIRLTSGVFTATSQNAGTTTTYTLPTYDPTAHTYWRLRELASSFYAETSQDGYAWTTLATMPYTWAPGAVQVVFQTGASDTEPSGLFAGISQVNTVARTTGTMPSWPQIQFAVAFNQGASASGYGAYVDLSSRLRGPWSADQSGRQYELDTIESGQLTVSLWNLDGALDPLNTSSRYSPYVLPMKPCRFQAVWPPTRNLHDCGFASATSTSVAYCTSGSITTGTVPTAPTGHTNAFLWTTPASGASTLAFGQGAVDGSSGFAAASSAAISLPGGGGGTWSVSTAVSSSPGTAAGITALLQLCWYDITGARILTNPSGTFTVPASGTWATPTVSATAPAGAVAFRPELLITSVTASASTFYVTASQAELAAAPTPWTPPGVTYPLWAGFVERWPQQWDDSGTYGIVDITGVDVLASLADFKLTQSTEASLLALGPTRLYPLDEPSGSVRFRDATSLHAALTIGNSNLGAGTITAGNSVTGTGSVGSTGPVVTIVNPVSNGFNQTGSYLSIPTPNGPPSTGGWTRIIAFRTTTIPSAGNVAAIWWWGGATGTPSQGGIYIDSAQGITVSSTNSSGTNNTAHLAGTLCDGNWHIVQMTLFPDGKSLAINVDGTAASTTGAADVHSTGITTDTIGMNANPINKSFVWPFAGDVAFATELPTHLNPTFIDMATGFATGWAGESSAVRAQRILTLSGYMGALSTVDATTAMGGASLAGVDAMSALQLVADSENGQVYADAAGVVQLVGRLWRYYQNAPAILIGELQAGGEIPYLDDVAVDFDTTHIYNQVSVTNQVAPGSPAPLPATYQNTVSSTAYAPRTLDRTINVNDPGVPAVAAQYLAQQYGNPLPRVEQVTVDAASNPALWATLLSLGFGSRVQLSRRPPSGPGAQPIALQQFLEKLSWAGDDQGNFKATMQLSSATPFLGWWVISSLHTTIHTAVSVGASSIVLDPLTGSSLNPAAAVLTPGTVLTLSYGDAAHQENVTVLSVGATSPGYTSVTVTLAANTAHSHSVGQIVCQPLPGGYTLPALTLAGFPASLDAGATLSATGPRVTY